MRSDITESQKGVLSNVVNGLTKTGHATATGVNSCLLTPPSRVDPIAAPIAATWISEDPKGFAAADTNLYRYVGNAATLAADPTGLAWYNPFTWFPNWDKAVDQELAIVKQLNKMFGTRHVRLDGFTPEERVRIETALGQKIDWEGGAIRASQGELELRDKVLVGSKVAAYGSGAAAGAALGGHFLGFGAAAATGGAAGGAGAGSLGVGSTAVVVPHLGAGTYPALLIDGTVYVARFHAVALEMAGGAAVADKCTKYGMVIIDATGTVLGWK